MKRKRVMILAAILLSGFLTLVAAGAAGGPGGGPPGGGGAPSGGGGGAPGGSSAGGFVAPSENKKNTEWAYDGVIVNIENGYIEMVNGLPGPNQEWWRTPMKVGTGQDTQVSQDRIEKTLTDLRIGQHIQVAGIYAKEGQGLPTDYLTTDYWGYYQGRENDIRHGQIQILSDETSRITEHQTWVENENARRQQYGLLKKLGEAK